MARGAAVGGYGVDCWGAESDSQLSMGFPCPDNSPKGALISCIGHRMTVQSHSSDWCVRASKGEGKELTEHWIGRNQIFAAFFPALDNWTICQVVFIECRVPRNTVTVSNFV